jgi:hypothetical protein
LSISFLFEKTPFFHRKLAKIAENRDHNVEPINLPKHSDSEFERKRRRKRQTAESEERNEASFARLADVRLADDCPELDVIDCHLETRDLWQKFNALGTEMIITKTGR